MIYCGRKINLKTRNNCAPTEDWARSLAYIFPAKGPNIALSYTDAVSMIFMKAVLDNRIYHNPVCEEKRAKKLCGFIYFSIDEPPPPLFFLPM